ncbi:MAG: lipid A biosynthesis acyltransferase [Pseudomonadota bacterium]|nr:lipid A biosynthesis acyltransferase [Pseudomonadota bacterium]
MSNELLHPRHWPSWLIVGIFRLLGLLPFRLLWALGMGLGRLSYFLAGSRRRVALRNLEICFPELSPRGRSRVAHRHFGYLGVAAFTQGLVWGSSRERLARLVKIRNRERFDDLAQEGRNLIIMVPHFVGLELGGAAFTALVHPGMYMYQKIRNPVIDAQMRRSRTRFGAFSVERRDDLRGMVREIRKGMPLFYLPDQDPGRVRGIFVPFCGIAAATVPMLRRFARLTDAVVIPTYARYLPGGQGLELIFDPPLAPFPTADRESDTALMNRVIEARARTMPEQYFWVHRRFKTRPPGEPPIYEPKRRR